MASYSFIHVTTEKTRQSRLDKHNDGRERPASALPRAAWDHKPTIQVWDNAHEYAEARAELNHSPKQRGRPGAVMVRVLFGHPPAFEDPTAWPKDRVLAWSRDSARWLANQLKKGSGGKAVLIRADLHADESRPHVHASVFPVVQNPDGRGVRLSWERVHMGITGAQSARESMRRLQTLYHEEVGKKYGMTRGTDAQITKAVRAEPDRVLGLRERARLTELAIGQVRRDGRRTRSAAKQAKREVRRTRQTTRMQERRDRGAQARAAAERARRTDRGRGR